MTEPPRLSAEGRAALKTVLALLGSEAASVSSVRDPAQAWRIHVDDSLSGLVVGDLAAAGRIADVGSGAGFPGLTLAAALPDSRVDLIESVERKCRFMEKAIEAATLANARVVCGRSEDWAASEGGDAYDAVVIRAVGRLSTLAELASPLLQAQGLLVAWKGRRDPEEEEEMARASADLAMTGEEILAVSPFEGSRNRHLHLIRKVAPTPTGLPRRPGLAKKRPLGSDGPRRPSL